MHASLLLPSCVSMHARYACVHEGTAVRAGPEGVLLLYE
jgi:hypothetical protein